MLAEYSQTNSCAKKIKLERNGLKLYFEDILKSKVPDLVNLCKKNYLEKYGDIHIIVGSHQGSHSFCEYLINCNF